MALTAKQQRFCEEYLIDLNATQAAIRAGYSEKTANRIACENLSKPVIKEKISELQAGVAERNKLKADDVIQELRALGFWSINDFIGEGNVINDISEQSREINKPVAGLKVKETFTTTGRGDDAVTERSVTTELKMADKRAALVDLGRHLGVFEKDNEQARKMPLAIKLKIVRPNDSK